MPTPIHPTSAHTMSTVAMTPTEMAARFVQHRNIDEMKRKRQQEIKDNTNRWHRLRRCVESIGYILSKSSMRAKTNPNHGLYAIWTFYAPPGPFGQVNTSHVLDLDDVEALVNIFKKVKARRKQA